MPGIDQGIWLTGSFDGHANWAHEMALVHDHIDPILERQDGSCHNGLEFIDPVVYQR